MNSSDLCQIYFSDSLQRKNHFIWKLPLPTCHVFILKTLEKFRQSAETENTKTSSLMTQTQAKKKDSVLEKYWIVSTSVPWSVSLNLPIIALKLWIFGTAETLLIIIVCEFSSRIWKQHMCLISSLFILTYPVQTQLNKIRNNFYNGY